MVNVFLSCRGGVCPPEYINVCIVGAFGQANPAPTVDCCNSVPTPWGSFPALGFCAHAVGKLSQLAILCPHCGEAFAACNSVLTLWGSFRGLQFRAHAVGKLSQPAIPCPRCGEAFAACDSVHGALKRLNDA